VLLLQIEIAAGCLPAGPSQGFLFERDTLDPLVRTPAFMRALQVMRELAALSEDTVPQVGRGPGLMSPQPRSSYATQDQLQ
jgi:hypothetical protein